MHIECTPLDLKVFESEVKANMKTKCMLSILFSKLVDWYLNETKMRESPRTVTLCIGLCFTHQQWFSEHTQR